MDETLRALKYSTMYLPLTLVESSQKVTLTFVGRRNIAVGNQPLDFVMQFVQICDVTSELGILYDVCQI
jgi:hypothetical protein